MSYLKPLTLPLEEVKDLLTSEEGTCLKKKEGRVTLQIPPKYGVDIRKGVKEELDAMSSRYSRQLGGIPMAWEKIRTSSTGALIDTSPYIHISVQGTFYIFSPEVDASLQGTVKKKSPSHLSCLVHRIFNVSVPRPQEVSAQEWEGSTVEEGDVIKIAVTNVDMSLYLPMITGRLESVVARKPPASEVDIFESATRKIFTDSGISGSEDEEDEEEKEEEIKVVAKKEKKNEKKKVKMKSSGDKKATKKVKKAKEKAKGVVSFVANRVGKSSAKAKKKKVNNNKKETNNKKKENNKKKKKRENLTLSEAESDALFLTSLIAEDAAGVISSSPRVSKKRKAEEDDSNNKKKRRKKEADV